MNNGRKEGKLIEGWKEGTKKGNEGERDWVMEEKIGSLIGLEKLSQYQANILNW